MSDDGHQDWTPARPIWRGGSGFRRLGPERAEPAVRAFSPTVDRMPAEARSVRVPAILALGSALLALVSMVVGVIVIIGALLSSGAVDDIDNVSADRDRAQIRICDERREELEQARRDHVERTGDQPDDIDDLDVGADDFVIGPDGRPVPAPGSACEGVDGGEESTTTAIEDRTRVAWVEVASAVGYVFFLLGTLSLIVAPGLLSWWLAEAFRCMPKAVRHKNPRRAYAIVRVYAVGGAVGTLAFVLNARYVSPDSLLVAAALWFVIAAVFYVAVIRALFTVIDMMTDVLFEFCDRHYGTGRAMRLSVWAYVLLPWLSSGLEAAAEASASIGWLATTLSIASFVVVTSAVVVAPIVFVVCLFITVVMATNGIDRALWKAAREIEVAEAEGRSLPSAKSVSLGV